MAAIVNLPLIPISESVHTSSAVLADLENVDVAFGILLLSCIGDEILRYFMVTYGIGGHFDLPVTPISESVHTSAAVLAGPENAGVAF